jgi:hypothetical protein
VGGGIVPPQPGPPPRPVPPPPAPPSVRNETYDCGGTLARATYSGPNFSSVSLSIGGLQLRLSLQNIVGGTGLSEYANGPYTWRRYASGSAQFIRAVSSSTRAASRY